MALGQGPAEEELPTSLMDLVLPLDQIPCGYNSPKQCKGQRIKGVAEKLVPDTTDIWVPNHRMQLAPSWEPCRTLAGPVGAGQRQAAVELQSLIQHHMPGVAALRTAASAFKL